MNIYIYRINKLVIRESHEPPTLQSKVVWLGIDFCLGAACCWFWYFAFFRAVEEVQIDDRGTIDVETYNKWIG